MANLKKDFLKSLNKNIFIEAGTHIGSTVDLALDCGFKKIYSCEPAMPRYEFCKDKFKNQINSKTLTLGNKSSKDFFNEILPDINEEAIFWLDSHKDDNVAGLEALPPCPIFDELDVISKHKIKTHTILIDDIRIFKSQVGWGKSMSLEKIKDRLLEINADYKITFEDGRTKGDILVCKI